MEELSFLTLMTNERLRPKQLKEVVGNIHKPKGMDSTVYKWTNLVNGKMYIGMHKESGKAYWTSSTNDVFKKLLLDPKSSFKLEIISWGSVSECKQLEYELLTKVDAQKNPMYYNKTNGSPGVKQCDFKTMKVLREDLDAIRFDSHNHEFKIINRDYLKEPKPVKVLYDLSRVQTRLTEYVWENLEKIKSKFRMGLADPQPPVLLENRKFDGVEHNLLMISGNHTTRACYETQPHMDLPVIIIPLEIHKNYSDSEIRLLSNELNRDRTISSPFTKEDAIKECLDLHNNGNSFATDYNSARFIDLGLTQKQVNKIFTTVELEIKNKKMKKSGKVVLTWRGSKDEFHINIINNTKDDILNDNSNTFIIGPYAGSSMTIDKIYGPYHKAQDERRKNNLPLYNNITCLIYNAREDLHKTYIKNKEEFEYIINKENMTPLNFVELPMYTEDTLTNGNIKKEIKNVENVEA